jgi:hypothetical protein
MPGGVGRVGEQLAPLGLERLLEQLAHLLQRAVELPLWPGLALALRDLAAQVVEARAGPSVPRRSRSRSASRGLPAVRHPLADLVERRRHVERRLERVAPAGPLAVAVPGSAHGRPARALKKRLAPWIAYETASAASADERAEPLTGDRAGRPAG